MVCQVVRINAVSLVKHCSHTFLRLSIPPDLDFLYSDLHDAHSHLSRFDVYKSEVETGRLQWGLVHTEKFFRENAKYMEGSKGDFALVKVSQILRSTTDSEARSTTLTKLLHYLSQRLISLIKTSSDDDIVSIACYDLGEFVRFYPNGRLVAKSLGAREVVLLATEHPNPDVQTQALLCISKILVQNWAVSGTCGVDDIVMETSVCKYFSYRLLGCL